MFPEKLNDVQKIAQILGRQLAYHLIHLLVFYKGKILNLKLKTKQAYTWPRNIYMQYLKEKTIQKISISAV